MATIRARSSWTSTSPRGTRFTWSRVRGIVCHYPAMGRSVGVLSASQEQARIRGWRSYHVNSLGWSDLGYNFIIGQSGRIYTGRGDRVAAHAVGHNSTTVGVLFIVGDNEPLTAAARSSFRALRSTLRRRGCGSGIWGHTQMSGNSTRCPGPYIMSDIRTGALKGSSSGATPAPSTPGLSDGLADVDKSQKWLAELGYSPGPVDGKFGSKTEAATRQFQTDFGITPADGRPGPATRTEMEAAVAKIDDILDAIKKNSWSHRGIDYVSPKGTPSTKDHQVSRAHQYAFQAPDRVWAHRGRDYVNEQNPSTADHQIARAHQYSYSAHLATRRIEAQVKGLNAAVSAMAESQGLDPARIEEIVQSSVDNALSDLSITLTADTEGDEG